LFPLWLWSCVILNIFLCNCSTETVILNAISGKAGGNVRVYNRKTAERALLKGFVGRIVDISFAFTSSVVLGIVDEVGGVYIYDITELPDGKLSYLFYQYSLS